MVMCIEFISKHRKEMALRDSINPEFMDTYAKMICLEGILEEFNNIVSSINNKIDSPKKISDSLGVQSSSDDEE
jgi:hypothetical protein